MPPRVNPIPPGYECMTVYISVRGAAGATVLQPLTNKFYGDRAGMIVDPFGHQWALMTHIEDVSP